MYEAVFIIVNLSMISLLVLIFLSKKYCVWGKKASLLRPGVAKNYFPVPTSRFLFRYN